MRKNLSCALLLVLVSAFVLFHFSYLSESPFARSFLLDYPYKVVLDSAGNSYIIDTSKRRVLKINPTGGFVFEIDGGRLSRFEIMTDETASTNFFFLHKEKHAFMISSLVYAKN